MEGRKFMQKIKRSLLVLIFFCSFALFGIQSEAATVLNSSTMYVLDKNDVAFHMPSKGIIIVDATIQRTDGKPFQINEKLKITLAKLTSSYTHEYNVYSELITLPDGSKQTSYETYHTELLPSGEYDLKFESKNKYFREYKISYQIKKYPRLATSIQLSKTNVQLESGKSTKFTVKGNPSGSYFWCDKIYSTNNSVAEIEWISRGDYVNTYKINAKKAGTCKIAVKGIRGGTKYIAVKVTNPKKPSLKYTSLYFYKGETEKNVLYTNSRVKWSSSNKSVATVDSSGKITAKNVGTCKIIARANGKNYVCKVTVQYMNPNFGAVLYSYYSRGKQFTVKFKNNGKKNLTILSTDASALHCDYTSLDRKLKVNATTIRPGQTKYVKFTAKDQPWYDWNEYTISYYFKYDGKKYNGHVWDWDSSFKDKGKWWCTYWTTFEDWYYDWKQVTESYTRS